MADKIGKSYQWSSWPANFNMQGHGALSPCSGLGAGNMQQKHLCADGKVWNGDMKREPMARGG